MSDLAVTLTVEQLRALVREAVREEFGVSETVPSSEEIARADDAWRPERDGEGTLHKGCRPTGFVYLIGEGYGHPVKIGWSTRPETRLSELQPGNPYALRLLLKIAACPDDEPRLHAKFADDRIRGEWFHWSEPIAWLYRYYAHPRTVAADERSAELSYARGDK